MAATYDYGAGVSSVAMFFCKGTGHLLYVPRPKGFYQAYSELRPLASGGVRGVGFPKARWHWDFLKIEWWDELNDVFTAASGDIVICTTINEMKSGTVVDDFKYFDCKYKMPLELEKDSYRRINVDIEFTHLVLLSPQPS